jgi:hypothetical protein
MLLERQQTSYLELIYIRDGQIQNFEKIIELKEKQINEYGKALEEANRKNRQANLRLKLYNRVGVLILGVLVISTL